MMTGDDRSVKAGGNIVGSQIITGDNNIAQMKDISVTLTSGEGVDIVAELAGLRQALMELKAGDQHGKIDRALQDAEEEAGKPQPNKDEIGSAVARAVKYAKNASDFAEHGSKIAERLAPVVSWLGENGTKILTLAGIAF
ncbi:hypothetical protein SAMN05421779_105309 [Insolitispirillum peregrinum]|uniref:Uncharacterized protein n=1 Tax=Insolitispirillum peregrinum TaxID=80876 RepID=A0A1N7NR67_9PROT|nr:hypothetical protein SAMN05421779_105309 [Insolitispirillum peregrinum]